MINVTQGDEESIGLEIFFKSIFLLPSKSLKKINLFGNKAVIERHLKTLNISYNIHKNKIIFKKNIELNFTNISNQTNTSFESFKAAVQQTKNESVLFTLPMSKKNFHDKNKQYKGHTDFFRKNFTNSSPKMFFLNGSEKLCLLTDHLPLDSVSRKINPEFFRNSLNDLISIIDRYPSILEIKNILLSGINPHAGEKGLIGNEEIELNKIINNIKLKTDIIISNLIPADTIHKKVTSLKETLLVFPYHDQGLCYFKPRNDILGINLTLGLPFIRLSVDHGTATNIWGKGIANPTGCYYALLKALEFERNIHE
tara:strand:- start:8046 stop:8981 length:936 start_codon:yes stop_codon:yes gene_type:complete